MGVMNFRGTLVKKFPAKSGKEWYKVDFVVNLKKDYLTFTAFNEQADNISTITEGEEVDVDYVVTGKAWTSKEGEERYFNSLMCKDVKKIGQQNILSDRHPINDKLDKQMDSAIERDFMADVDLPF